MKHLLLASALLSKPLTTYLLHLAGDMRGADGRGLDHLGCATPGGGTVIGSMMSGYNGTMMGSGWRSADGAYGMIFTFITA